MPDGSTSSTSQPAQSSQPAQPPGPPGPPGRSRQPAGHSRGSVGRSPRVAAVAGGLAAVLAVAFLLAPPMGTDLPAQVARADFVDRYGFAPIDFGWYGGVHQFGYSLFTAPLGAVLGVRPVAAVAAVIAAAAFGWLLRRHRARRPLLGGVLGAVVLVGNLVSGRFTFAVGLAFGLLALCAVSATRPARPARLPLAALLAALATWASPVAGLFTGLAGGALLLASLHRGRGPGRMLPGGWRADRPLAESLTLCLTPVVAVAPMAALFGDGGYQPFTAASMRLHVALALVVLLAVPRRRRVLRIGAGLTVLLLIAAYYLPSPIGSNALRLPMLFALPVLAAFAALPTPWLAGLLVAVVWWQPPVVLGDLTRAGSPPSRAAYYRPLADELARRAPIGRVEVVPLRDHGEAAYLPRTVPLARGWERQADTARNPLFYRPGLTADRYADWLRRNAVSYVAIAVDSPPDSYAREEATLVTAGLPYLTEVWRGEHWRLYAVADPAPLVAAPGRLVESTREGIRFTVAGGGDMLIRVSWSRWLSLTGPAGCLEPGPDGFVTVHDARPGEYHLTSALRPQRRCAR